MNKQIIGRVQHKHDTEANWLKATNFIPLDGELIVYDADEQNKSPRVKIGDGHTIVSDLTFASAEIDLENVEFAHFDADISTPEGSAPSLDADSLGGIPASSYVTSDEVEASYVKASIEEVIMGEIVKSKADFATEATHAVSADEATHANEADRALETDNSLMLGGKEPKYYIQPRNLLDNSDFTNIVNQRNVASGSVSLSSTYFIDRWMTYQGLINNMTYSFLNSGLQVASVASVGGDYGVTQRLPVALLLEETYTLAAMIDGVVYVGSFVPSIAAAGNITIFNDSGIRLVFMPDYVGFNAVNIRFDTSKASHTIKWAALYEGEYTAENLPPYVSKGYAVELAECQRYFVKFDSGNEPVWLTAVNTNYAVGAINFPVYMRIIPTLKILGCINLNSQSVTVTTSVGTEKGVSYLVGTFTAHDCYRLMFEASADL